MTLPARLSEPAGGEDWLSWSPGTEDELSWPGPDRGSRRSQRAAGPRATPRQEVRRRMRLIRRRRLDLLQDSALALLLAIFVLVESAGLGVVALLGTLTALALVASLVIERRRARASGSRPRASKARGRG